MDRVLNCVALQEQLFRDNEEDKHTLGKKREILDNLCCDKQVMCERAVSDPINDLKAFYFFIPTEYGGSWELQRQDV